VTIDHALAERLTAELRRRDASWREARKRLHDVFAEELGPLPEEPPVALGELAPEQLAALTVDLLWPPSQEERRMRSRRLLDDVFDEVCGDKAGVPDADR